MTSIAQTPAGWYPDPENPAQERLFDGIAWTDARRPPRGRFAAKHAKRGAGVTLLVIGILFALGIPGSIGGIVTASERLRPGAVAGLVLLVLIAGGLITWAVYFLRGRGENPAVAARRAQQQLAAEQQFHAAVDDLARVRTGAAGLVALRNVDAAAGRAYGAAGPRMSADAVAAIGVDPASFASVPIGNLAVLGAGVWLELFRDWVIMGQQGYDVDANTRITVFLDGGIQIVPRQVQRGNRVVTVNEQHDMRRAEVQVVSDAWSVRAPINPDEVGEARRMADQLTAHVARLSSGQFTDLVEALIANTGQPPAEKLKQLADLRYDRLLSDEEFQRAKERILRIG